MRLIHLKCHSNARFFLGAVCAALLICHIGCRKSVPADNAAGGSAGAEAANAKPIFDLPGYPLELAVVQRTAKVIPGTDGRLLVVIDDITDGQVRVAIRDSEDRVIVAGRSVRAGDAIRIDYEHSAASLKLNDLRNAVVGDDIALFAISRIDDGNDRSGASATDMSEVDRIERLIQSVANLDGATFLRNGKSYTAAEAAEHLRDKWAWKRDDIRTAEDFVELCASRSSVSGEAYMIRLADGTETTSRAFLLKELAKMDEDRASRPLKDGS